MEAINSASSASSTSNGSSHNSNSHNGSTGKEMDFLEVENLVKSVLSCQPTSDPAELKRRDEIIRTLFKYICHERQISEEARQAENLAEEALENIKHQVKDISRQMNKYKESVHQNKAVLKSSECQTDLPPQATPSSSSQQLNLEASFEQCRYQGMPNQHSTLFLDSNHHHHQQLDQHSAAKSATTSAVLLTNGNAQADDCDPNLKKMLLDQIKVHEEKIQTERLSYLQENERLNRVIEEKTSTIKELKSQLRRSSNSSTSVLNSTSSSSQTATFVDAEESIKDYSSRVQGYGTATNNRMLHVLSDLVKTFLDTENDIQKQLEALGLENGSTRAEDSGLIGFTSLDDERISDLTFDGLCDDGPDLTTPSSMIYSTNHSLNNGNNTTNDIEDDVVLGASRRLRLGVERVLKILNEVVSHHSQTDIKGLLKEKEDLANELQEEVQRRDQLTRQLLDKESALHRMEGEKRALVERTTDYGEVKAERDQLKLKLEEYERDRKKFINDHKRFEAEKNSFNQGLPQLQQKLMREKEALNRDINQLQQEKMNLTRKIDSLTAEVETLKTEKEQIVEVKNAEIEELFSQIEAFEKNHSSLKRFMEEQTQERECEREEFTKEVTSLKEKIKEKEKTETKCKANIRSLENQLTFLNEDKVMRDEQFEEMAANLKEANLKATERSLALRQLETDLERSSQVEVELRQRLKELSRMDDKIRLLNTQVDGLLERNSQLKEELRQTEQVAGKLEEIKAKMEAVEGILHEKQKENEMLHQEINDNHMKYSELKVKLESSVDVHEFRKVVTELQGKLQAEKRDTESVTVKLEQANRHVGELEEKLDAYRKEIKSYKDLLKSHELDSKHLSKATDKQGGELRAKYDAALVEVNQLQTRLANKEKSMAVLEQNIDRLKAKMGSLSQEKDLYLEKLQSADESQSRVVLYEKNLEKLRLQNKISSDRVTYLQMEIKSLQEKIGILERENDYLKVENQKLHKLRAEVVSAAMSESEDNVDSLSVSMNPNINSNLYLNGLDKIPNSISSNNLLMLKVRRLLSQKGALIYQKNYLIHLLNGFQITENATLALLSNLNHSKDVEEIDSKMRGKQRFRSAVYALIALSRMKYMVNVWQCRKRQLMVSKTAHAMSNNLQNLPVPPKKLLNSSSGSNSVRSTSSSSASSSPVHFSKRTSMPSQISSTMKDYVDRLHVVHETLGLHTNKL
ncbi:PREDICTED: putative uncharacterized protein MYH16 [Rhagoletis zephyria]|uniref:putative uncharacterized protein MYH16 n=1 Tax=Rhagoletis zephyria TaxID=28612 RepID=UPI0008114B3E|nr:PREDICTED: putative uncharacterized protein MYH16 [Rhagoletis zephyria]